MRYFLASFLLFVFGISLCAQDSTVVAMSYNIYNDYKISGDNTWDYRRTSVSLLLGKYKPSILGVQEALSHQVYDLNEDLKNYSYVGKGAAGEGIEGEYCAIFIDTTRFDIEEEGTFWLSSKPTRLSVSWGAESPQVCTYVLVKERSSGGMVWVFNTQFSSESSKARANSAKLILRKMRSLNKEDLPMLLMGDLNDTKGSAPIVSLKKKLQDGLKISKEKFDGEWGTYNGFEDTVGEERIDYIFTSGLKVENYRHINEKRRTKKQISDHSAVYMTFILPAIE